jgi:hypothetical protein
MTSIEVMQAFDLAISYEWSALEPRIPAGGGL